MTLPKIDFPIYELRIPSTDKPIKVRPFLVKEEKLLLMALASNDDQQIIDTTKQIINNCILDDTDISKLAFFDIDYLFIALRAKSVGEAVDVRFTCNYKADGENRCGFIFPVKLDIANVAVKNKDVSKDIKLTEKQMLRMKYPSYDIMKMLSSKEDNLSKKIKIIVACLDKIFDGDQAFSSKDYSKEELESYIENLTEVQFRKVDAFVSNLPYFLVVSQHECPKCNFKHRIEYTDFTSFFR
jgi:hypothetical protein